MRGSFVWRALDRARAKNLAAAGLPAPRPSPALSRRQAIAAIGGGAAALSLPGCFRADGVVGVAVIGGGLAGLVALDRLRSRGVDARLYEARGAAGGRTRSARGIFAPGYAFDLGGQLVNSDHADMIALAKRLGLSLIDRRALGEKQEVQVGPDGIAGERALAKGLRSIARQITADADRLDADPARAVPEIDAMSAADYLDSHGMKAGVARTALEAAIRTEYGAEPSGASAIELLFNLPTIDGERVTRLSLSDERFLIDGGTGQVADRLAELHRPAIAFNKRLVAVDLTGTGATLVFADGEKVACEQVVMALPASVLKDVKFEGPLSPLWREAIGEIALGHNEKLIVGYDRPAWREAIGASGAFWAADGFSEAWDAASSAPTAGPGALTYFLGGEQVRGAGKDSRLLAERFTGLARKGNATLGEPNGHIRRTRWCDDPLSRGAYINFRPGQISRFASLLTLEEEGKVRPSRAGPLVFAGEWVSDAWPGYMNGAAQTGRIAADAVLADIKARAAA